MTETVEKGGTPLPRPTRCRRICAEPAYDSFRPDGIDSGGEVVMTLDEYEAIRLIDLQHATQEQCAAQMMVARATVTSIYDAARRKVAEALVHGRGLLIQGGDFAVCEHSGHCCGCCGQGERPCCQDCGATEFCRRRQV